MKYKTTLETTKIWRIPELGNLELLQAKYVTRSFPRYTHERYAVGVIEDGALGFYYRGENMVAYQGSINLCIPGEVHTGYSASEIGWTYRMFYFDPKLFQQAASEIADYSHTLPFFPSGVIHDDYLAQCFRKLHIKLEQQNVPLLEQESCLIWTLTQMILGYADDPPILRKLGSERFAIRQIKLYIENNYAENISIDNLTRIAHLSRFHLIRVFRDSVGIPPHTYLRQVRIQKAKELLSLGKPIADVAAATGFADQSHLTRAFKRLWGFTPGQYSNNVQYIQS